MVQHINQLFPTEQSLAGLDDTMAELTCQVKFFQFLMGFSVLYAKVSTIEDEMREMVRAQTAVGGDAAGALEEAQTAIIQLFR